MSRLDNLRRSVKDLYEAKTESRADWADWFYGNHVLIVADNARSLAMKYDANAELSEVAALLHDIADVRMQRSAPEHEAESLKIARELMETHDYTPDEIALTIDDAIRYHSCHGDERPKSKEGLILAAADSLAHLQTDFYLYAAWAFGGRDMPLAEVKAWTLDKIDRDLNNKISFEDEHKAAQASYNMLKELFSR